MNATEQGMNFTEQGTRDQFRALLEAAPDAEVLKP